MAGQRVTRREVVAAGAAAAGAAVLAPRAAAASAWSETLDFAKLGDADGWPGWACAGVANVRRSGGRGLLEAGSDVFPCDPRPVAFAVDRRFRDGEISAVIASAGAGTGLVLRRTGPRDYYAAVLDDEQRALVLLRRSPKGVVELGRAPVGPALGSATLVLAASGVRPTLLSATLAGATAITVTARDGAAPLQGAGDAGVLATARTLFPSAGPPPLPALGNLHLLPYGVQEGQAVMETAVGHALLDTIRERSTAAFSTITIRSSDTRRPTRPSVIAATTGAPINRGARLRVATDVPARVEIEVATNRAFRRSRRVRAGATDSFNSALVAVSRLEPGRRVYWRARLERRGVVSLGPARSFKVLPGAGDGRRATIAIGACASQFGPSFDQLAARKPDVFVWQGDLNYPDTIGPLAQTVPGYAGIWRDFLANPRMDSIFGESFFAAQRDDHDYGVQDANSAILVPQGLAPWEGLVESRLYYRFTAGHAEFWVLDQRRFKTDPKAADTPAKTLLGRDQREWLLRTLASSRAHYKVVCSPCTLAPLPANGRDGSWATGFTAERDLVLEHIRERVSGRTLFVTGDTHWTMVYEHDGLFEARPCPLGIPTPNDITLTDPQVAEDARGKPGVLYADDDKSHFAFVEVSGDGLDLSLVREDGAVPFRRHFQEGRVSPPRDKMQRR
ncbi:MAG TPA: alkaline phosphatase D family protein [Thermoleophilaceae bacterium]|nr:alkaline phosphatase D family protein [Thermoleophilaceae bacterium]